VHDPVDEMVVRRFWAELRVFGRENVLRVIPVAKQRRVELLTRQYAILRRVCRAIILAAKPVACPRNRHPTITENHTTNTENPQRSQNQITKYLPKITKKKITQKRITRKSHEKNTEIY
jgi:hypothetical protein